MLRDDLYYRLAGARRRTQPGAAARRRPDSCGALSARHGLRAPKLGSKALEALQNYAWPGNVRELAHTCDRLAALYPGADLETLPESLDAQTSPAQAGLIIDPNWTLEAIEARVIDWTLERFDGNRQATAKHLGIGVRTLYRRLKDDPPTAR